MVLLDMNNNFMFEAPVEEFSAAFDDGRAGFVINDKVLKDKLLLITTRAANAYNEFAGKNKFRFSINVTMNQCSLIVPFEDYDGILLEVSEDWSTIDRYYVRKTLDGWFLTVDHNVDALVTVTDTGRVKPEPVMFPEENYTKVSRASIIDLFINLHVRNVRLFLAGNEILNLPLSEYEYESAYTKVEEPEVVLSFLEVETVRRVLRDDCDRVRKTKYTHVLATR